MTYEPNKELVEIAAEALHDYEELKMNPNIRNAWNSRIVPKHYKDDIRNQVRPVIAILHARGLLAPEWQPIETAPKDGTIFDVWLGDADESDRQFYCTGDTRRSPGWWWNGGKFRACGGLPGLTTFV